MGNWVKTKTLSKGTITMKALVFDPFSGASGDMILGSLLDLGVGVDDSKIADAISAFSIEMEVKEEEKRGIVAKSVKFSSKIDREAERERGVKSYEDIVRTIEESGLSERIIDNSLSVFELIAKAEEKVHGKAKESLTFHEIGAIDTIGDLIGNSIAFLDIHAHVDSIISTPILVGGGFVDTEHKHGRLPVPAPATLEILKNTSLLSQGGPFASELLTPTGAAILAHFVHHSEPFFPLMQIEKIGYGAGSKDLPMPNVLRAVIGKIEESVMRDKVEVLETNVDNVTGEVLGALTEVLMEEGAKDVAIMPAMMKKGRTGHVIRVITAPQDVNRIAYRIMQETGSLGVRVMQIKHRFIANREERKVKTRIKGIEKKVGVKIGRDSVGNLINISAEFEDAKKVARELKMPVKDVLKIVEENARLEIQKTRNSINIKA